MVADNSRKRHIKSHVFRHASDDQILQRLNVPVKSLATNGKLYVQLRRLIVEKRETGKPGSSR